MERIAHFKKKKSPNESLMLGKFLMLPVVLAVIAEFAITQDDLFADTNFNRPPFNANVVYYRDGNGAKTLTVIFVEVPYSNLSFVRNGAGDEAIVEVAVILDDAKGMQVDGYSVSDTIRMDNFDTARSHNRARLFCFRFRLEPGRYALRATVDDAKINHEFFETRQIQVPSFHARQLQISSVQLAYEVKRSANGFPSRKNGRILMPNVPHVIAQEDSSSLVYFEAYNLEPVASETDSFRIHYSVQRDQKVVFATGINYPKRATRVAVTAPLKLGNLEPGKYRLTVTVMEPSGKYQASALARFHVIPSLKGSSDDDLGRTF